MKINDIIKIGGIMKNNKGFTLMELMGVIIILAVLALIVTPIVVRTIAKAEKNSAARSLEGYVSTLEQAQANYQAENGVFTDSTDNLEIEGKNLAKIEHARTYYYTYNGKVAYAEAYIGDYFCTYKINENAKCEESLSSTILKSVYDYKGYEIALDNLNKKYSECVDRSSECTDEMKNKMMQEMYQLEAKYQMSYMGISLENIDQTRAKTINFYSDGRIISNANSYNVANDGSSKIKLYVKLNETDSSLTDWYFVSDQVIYLNKYSNVLFSYFTSLQSINFNNSVNTSDVVNMSYMFAYCQNLTSIDFSSFDTAKVIDLSGMFSDCASLKTLNLSNFNTSNVIDMSLMFFNCPSLTSLNVSGFDTSKANSLYSMFYGCSSLSSLDVTSFDVSKAKDLSSMFFNCNSLTNLDLSSFDMTNIANATHFLPDKITTHFSPLTTISVPLNLKITISLPNTDFGSGCNIVWSNMDNTIYYSTLPTNVAESYVIKAGC